MFPLIIELPGLPKMTNTSRAHWRYLYAETKKWKTAIAFELARLGYFRAGIKPLSKAKITITRFSSAQPDYDGLVSSGKRLLDALVDSRVIEDDKMNVIGIPEYKWERTSPGKGKIIIVVEVV